MFWRPFCRSMLSGPVVRRRCVQPPHHQEVDRGIVARHDATVKHRRSVASTGLLETHGAVSPRWLGRSILMRLSVRWRVQSSSCH